MGEMSIGPSYVYFMYITTVHGEIQQVRWPICKSSSGDDRIIAIGDGFVKPISFLGARH